MNKTLHIKLLWIMIVVFSLSIILSTYLSFQHNKKNILDSFDFRKNELITSIMAQTRKYISNKDINSLQTILLSFGNANDVATILVYDENKTLWTHASVIELSGEDYELNNASMSWNWDYKTNFGSDVIEYGHIISDFRDPLLAKGWLRILFSRKNLDTQIKNELLKTLRINGIVLCFGLILCLLLLKSALKSVREITIASKKILSGDIESITSIESDDEIGELAENFNVLASRLKESNLSSELKNRLIGMAAHDLRNPVVLIKGYSDLLQNGFIGKLDDAQIKAIQKIDLACQRMLRMLEDLLDISAIESGHLALHKENTDLKSFLTDTYEYNKLLAEMKGIELILEFDNNLAELNIDKDKMGQALNNLIDNAIKFSKENTKVVIIAKNLGSETAISVIDQGCGIAEKDLNGLFNPFSKTDNQPERGEKCTGLGLAIVKKLVEVHAGKISVSSQVGRGSNFTILLKNNEKVANNSTKPEEETSEGPESNLVRL